MPVVAVALGALLLDQPVTWEMLAGGMLVIAAVYIGAIAGMRGAEGIEQAGSGSPAQAAAEPSD